MFLSELMLIYWKFFENELLVALEAGLNWVCRFF